MKKYEGLVILENSELAESVYAASGTEGGTDIENDTECWTVSVSKDQVVEHEGYANFRVQANHPGNVVHISSQSKVVIVFNQTITSAEFEGNGVSINGCTVTLTRASHGNAYNSADQYNSLLKVYAADPNALAVESSSIYCTHETNVQGGID